MAGGRPDMVGTGIDQQGPHAMAHLASAVSTALQHLQFPNESPASRRARTALLAEEMELRRQVERVAAQRRALPQGGKIPEDYVFEGIGESGRPEALRLSQLFAPGHDTLLVYSFMFGPQMTSACASCTSILDGLDGQVPHVTQRVNMVVVASTRDHQATIECSKSALISSGSAGRDESVIPRAAAVCVRRALRCPSRNPRLP